MSEPAKVFEDRETPGQWRVEWFDDDGSCEVEIFTGSDARTRALRYAVQRYSHFVEKKLEPYPGSRNLEAPAGFGRKSQTSITQSVNLRSNIA